MKTCDYTCETKELLAVIGAPYHAKEMGLDHVYLVGITLYVCQQCGNQDAEIPRLARLIQTLALHLLCMPRYLSGPELRYCRKAAEMSVDRLAEFAGISADSIRSWERHGLPIKADEAALRIRLAQWLECEPEVRVACKGDWQAQEVQRRIVLEYNGRHSSGGWRVREEWRKD